MVDETATKVAPTDAAALDAAKAAAKADKAAKGPTDQATEPKAAKTSGRATGLHHR